MDIDDIKQSGNYLVDGTTGEKIVFYECDPAKNMECKTRICRAEDKETDGGLGFCSKTINPLYRKDGGKAWYAVLKTPDEGEPYWGREYIEVD